MKKKIIKSKKISKTISVDKLKNKHIGKLGTKKREVFEAEVKKELQNETPNMVCQITEEDPISFIIINNTYDSQNVELFNQFKPINPNVEIKNSHWSSGGDDYGFSLKSLSKKDFKANLIRIFCENKYQFEEKWKVYHRDYKGKIYSYPVHPVIHFDENQYQKTIIDIAKNITLELGTEINFNILPKTTVHLTFFNKIDSKFVNEKNILTKLFPKKLENNSDKAEVIKLVGPMIIHKVYSPKGRLPHLNVTKGMGNTIYCIKQFTDTTINDITDHQDPKYWNPDPKVIYNTYRVGEKPLTVEKDEELSVHLESGQYIILCNEYIRDYN